MGRIRGFAGAETGGLFELSSGSIGLTASATTANSGGYSFRYESRSSPTSSTYTPPLDQGNAPHTGYITGFAFRYTGTMPNSQTGWFCGLGNVYSSSNSISVGVQTDGSGNCSLRAAGHSLAGAANSTSTLSADTWYYIEVYHDNKSGTAGTIKVYIDGVLEITITGIDTSGGQGDGDIHIHHLDSDNFPNVTYTYIDDIYMMDNVSSVDERLGAVEIYGHVCDETTAVPDFLGSVITSSQGSTLGSGTWDNTATLTTTDLAEYTTSADASGADGIPLDSSISSTHTIHAALGLFNAQRSGGGATPKSFVIGRTAVDATPSNQDRHLVHSIPIALTTAFAEYTVFSKYADPIASFTEHTSSPLLSTSILRSIIAYNGRAVAGAGNDTSGDIIYSDDGGDTWTAATDGSEFTGLIYALAVKPSNGILVGAGQNGDIAYSDDDGDTWTAPTTNPLASDIGRRAVYDPVHDHFVVCTQTIGTSAVVYSDDDGDTWTKTSTTVSGNSYALCFDPGSGNLILGTSLNIFYSTNGGVTWTACTTKGISGTVWGLGANPSGVIVAGGASGAVFYSTDGGDTFTEATDSGLVSGTIHDITWFDSYFVATSLSGDLLVSTDGDTWVDRTSETVASVGSIYSSCFDQVNGKIITVGANENIWHSEDLYALPDPSSTDVALLGMWKDTGGQDMTLAWAINMLLTTPSSGTTYNESVDLDHSLTHAAAQATIIGAATSLGISLEHLATGLWSTSASVSIDHSLEHTASYDYDAFVSLTLGIVHDIATEAGWSTDAAVTLSFALECASIGEVIREASVALGVELSQAQAITIAYQVVTSLDHSLSHTSTSEWDTDASTSIGVSLDTSFVSEVIYEAAASLGISLTQAQAAEITVEAAVLLDHVLDQGIATEWETSALASIDHTLAQSSDGEWVALATATLGLLLEKTTNAGWSTDEDVSIDHSLSQSQIAGWITDGLASLDHSLSHSATAQTVIGAIVELALSLDQAQVAEFSAQTFEAAVTMAIELVETGSASIGHAAQVAIDHVLETDSASQVDFDGQLSVSHALEVNRVGQSDFVGAVTLSHDLGYGVVEQKIISVAVSLALELGATTAAAQIIESLLTLAVDLEHTSSSAGSIFEAALSLPLAFDIHTSYSNDLFVTLALSHSLSETGAPTWSAGANVLLDHLLGEDAGVEQTIETGVSLDHTLGEDPDVTQTVESFLTLAHELTQAGSAERVTDAVTTFAHSLGQNAAGVSVLSSAVLLAHQLAQTPGASVDWAAVSTFDHALEQSPIAGWITDASVSLDISLLESEIGQNVTAAVLELAYDIALTTTSTISTQNIFAAVTLGVELAQDEAVDADYAAQLALGHVLLTAESVDWVAYASVAMDHALAANSVGSVTKEAVLSLATSMGLSAEAANVVEGAVTLAVELAEAADVSVEYAAQLALGHMLYTYEVGSLDALASLTLTHALEYQTTATVWSAVFESSPLRTTTAEFEARTLDVWEPDRVIIAGSSVSTI